MPRVLTEEAVGEFRDRLIDAAERLFARDGLDAVTMRQLAAEVGVSPMTPYRYFNDKDAILAAVRTRAFNRHAEALEAAWRKDEDPIAASVAVGRAYLRFAFEHPAAYKLMFDLEPPSGELYPDLVAACVRSRATMTAHLRAIADTGAAIGDPDAAGHIFWCALHGAIRLQFAGMLAPPFDADRLAAAATATIWSGLLARNAR